MLLAPCSQTGFGSKLAVPLCFKDHKLSYLYTFLGDIVLPHQSVVYMAVSIWAHRVHTWLSVKGAGFRT
jgi:hypothetical protein